MALDKISRSGSPQSGKVHWRRSILGPSVRTKPSFVDMIGALRIPSLSSWSLDPKRIVFLIMFLEWKLFRFIDFMLFPGIVIAFGFSCCFSFCSFFKLPLSHNAEDVSMSFPYRRWYAELSSSDLSSFLDVGLTGAPDYVKAQYPNQKLKYVPCRLC